MREFIVLVYKNEKGQHLLQLQIVIDMSILTLTIHVIDMCNLLILSTRV